MFTEAVVHGPAECRQALSGNINAEAKMRCLRQVYFLSSRLPPAICNPPYLLGFSREASGFYCSEVPNAFRFRQGRHRLDEFLFPRSQLL